jgi:uncharacterized membrane-anchored protein YjiN (DUF445 family)
MRPASQETSNARSTPKAVEAAESRRPSLALMRLIATGLLALMVVTFFVARTLEQSVAAFGYVRAFAEAATVGALADWFAVTALFRHPLGLPIPHTAIIPKSKDRIGVGFGKFLESNFLSPDLLVERLSRVDLLGEFAKWTSRKGRARLFARTVVGALPRALDLIEDRPVETALQEMLRAQLRGADIASLAADALDFLTSEGRHRAVMDYLIRAANALVNESELDIRASIRANSGFFARLFSLDRRAADAIVDAVRGALSEMAADPESQLRQRLDMALAQLASDLRQSKDLRADVEQLKARAIDHPDVQAFAEAVWRAFKRDLKDNAQGGAEALAKPLESAIRGFSERLVADEGLRQALNARLREWIVRVSAERGGDVSRFVAETIKDWDARTVIARIEAGVGADLQYIRISGTLIGGLVGLAIHVIETTFF